MFDVTVEQMVADLHDATVQPDRHAPYWPLYELPAYVGKQGKKSRHAKKLITRDRVCAALASNAFWKMLQRAQEQYPEFGSREKMYYLVGKC